MDKLLHISFSYAITLTGFVLFHNIFYAILIGVLLSIVKEIWDYVIKKQDAKERSKDLICDSLGIILSTMIIFIRS